MSQFSKISMMSSSKLNSYLSHRGMKHSKRREIIIDYFIRSDRHYTVEQLYAELKRRHHAIGYSTVYRTLKIMAECGIATAHRFGRADTRYEPVQRKKHHDHLVCQGCGKIIEFSHDGIEQYQKDVAKRHKFSVCDHELQIFGLCQICHSKQQKKKRKDSWKK